jgi:hypothetical protein
VIRAVNGVLDWAERRTWVVAAAGCLLGTGLGTVSRSGWRGWGWGLLAAGIVLTAIRPAGTQLRRRHEIREIRRLAEGSRVT